MVSDDAVRSEQQNLPSPLVNARDRVMLPAVRHQSAPGIDRARHARCRGSLMPALLGSR
jgi:hypothetical protein